jgi:hypothetical protein
MEIHEPRLIFLTLIFMISAARRELQVGLVHACPDLARFAKPCKVWTGKGITIIKTCVFQRQTSGFVQLSEGLKTC